MLLLSDATEKPDSEKPPVKFKKPNKIGRFFETVYPYLPWLLPVAGAVLALVHTHILLGPDINRSGDNMYHILNEYAVLRAILGGDNPLGPVGMEFGQPVLRFYQALFYLWNIAVALVTGFDLMALHNITIVVCFAASPFALMYFLRKIGLRPWAAGLGAFASMMSIASFGNSFEAYHQSGIVTQSMGGLFFPWFMGNFIGMCKGENRASTTALLFAIAFVSHAIMAVFAVFSGALYFLCASSHITKKGLLKLPVFCALGILLVAFWVFPFIEHTKKMRPIPDSIVRGAGVHWFTSVSKDELGMVLFSGRLLDDPIKKGDQRDADDKFMDKISIIHALSSRPPAITILTGLGFLVALLGIRITNRRFLLTGFLFCLFLFSGPDDYPLLWYLPFMDNIQTFRCTYLVEFFAFGMIGLGVETVLRHIFWFAMRRRILVLKWGLVVIWFGGTGTLLGFGGWEILRLGKTHLTTRDTGYMDIMVDACSTIPDKARPFRIQPKFSGRFKLRQSWFSVYGYIPYCTHWKGTGPSAALHLCGSLGSAHQYGDLNALAGARYFSGSQKEIEGYVGAKDSDGMPAFRLMNNGPIRGGRTATWHKLIDTGRESFLRPLVTEPLPVVCSHSQWVWLAKSWTTRYRSNLWVEETPTAMRVKAGGVGASGLLEDAQSILYLDHSKLEQDREALANFVDSGGMLISPTPIEGIETVQPEVGVRKTVWDALPNVRKNDTIRPSDHREEIDPGFDIADIRYLRRNWQSIQNFAFDVDALKPLVAVLPMEAVPGWRATLNGKPLTTFATGPDLVGVYIPKGAYRLIFEWEMPLLGWASLIMTLVGLLIVFAIWGHAGWTYFRRRRAV